MNGRKEEDRLRQESVLKWSSRAGIAVIVLLGAMMVRAGLSGKFDSVETFQAYIEGFGLFAPMILILFQAFQVVVPVLPGFLGCIVGALMFGSAGGFLCNYIGICSGSIAAFFLARQYGTPLVEKLFPDSRYKTWIRRLNQARSYDILFFLAILLPLAPDDFLCYFSGLIKMSMKKFILLILVAKPWCLLFYSFGTGMLAMGG